MPLEALLCLAASLVVNHRRFSGRTRRPPPLEVVQLAQLFKRPPSSILAKMANLDGSMRNAGKNELLAGVVLLADVGRLTETYLCIFQEARKRGVDGGVLRDFLGLESGRDIQLLGQEEIDQSDLAEVLRGEFDRWGAFRSDLEDALTMKIVEVSARVGQHRFASEVLTAHGHRCVFCGLGLETDGRPAQRMLVAGHIKPWRVATNSERLDPLNGLTACPTHDVAFDTGLLRVDAQLRVHVRPDIALRVDRDQAIRESFGSIVSQGRLSIPPGVKPPKVDYLTWHSENVYQGHVA